MRDERSIAALLRIVSITAELDVPYISAVLNRVGHRIAFPKQPNTKHAGSLINLQQQTNSTPTGNQRGLYSPPRSDGQAPVAPRERSGALHTDLEFPVRNAQRDVGSFWGGTDGRTTLRLFDRWRKRAKR